MAKNIVKRCKTLGISPATMGYTGSSKSETIRNSQGDVRRKQSEYAVHLKEKQKVKFIYGVQEKQFRLAYEKAEKMTGQTGEILLSLMERRLDNVVYRLGFAMTRAEARQMVSHAHFTVDGHKVNIPSFLVKPGMVVAVKETSRGHARIKANIETNSVAQPPKWLALDAANMSAKVVANPTREDIDFPVEEQLIVEFYSK
ncbi:MAG: 30S ribosomal protein S4 [Clostridia bacterium]|nr:30S ribosomal protein S4 [Clostridia bacterium]